MRRETKASLYDRPEEQLTVQQMVDQLTAWLATCTAASQRTHRLALEERLAELEALLP